MATALYGFAAVPSRTAHAACDPSFFCETVYPAAPNSHGLVVRDFNADGIADIAVVNGSGSVTVHLGRGQGGIGDGTFAPPVTYPVPGQAFGIAAGDFNADGIVDLATANTQGTISILLGQGVPGPADGTFAPAVSYPAVSGPFAIAAGDFNHDGVTDLAVSINSCPSGRVAILLGNSEFGVANGTFGPSTTYPVGCYPAWLAARDLNSDGILDLAVVVYNQGGPGRLAILNGLGSGGVGNGAFDAPTLYTTRTNPYDLRFADFNGDGIPDVAVSGVGGLSVSFGGGSGGVGDGTFGPAFTVSTTAYTGLEVGDFNGDGVMDIAAVGVANGSALSLFLGQTTGGVPNGQFSSVPDRPVGYGPIQVAAGDFNADGRTDLAVANYYGGTLSILLNLGPGHGPSETAGWAADGVSLSSAAGPQTLLRAAADGAGGAIAVWKDRRSATNAVYAQRVGRNGNILWRGDGVPVADSTDDAQPQIAGDGLGGAWVAWLQSSASSPAAVRLGHVTAAGTKDASLPAAGIAISGPGFVATDLALSADGAGGVLVGYAGAGADAVAILYCERVGAGGTVAPGWPSAGGVAVARWTGPGSGSFAAPDLSPDGAGGASMTWRTRDSDPTCAAGACVYSGVARVGGGGDLLHGDAFRFPEDDAYGVPAGPGSEVMVTETEDAKILARHIGSAGDIEWTTPLCAAAGERQLACLAAETGGGAAAVWIDRRMGDWDLYAGRVAADGSLASGWPADGLPVCVAAGDQVEPQVLAASAQGLTLCWVDRRAGNDALYALRLGADGTPSAGWPAGGRRVCPAAGAQQAPVLVESPPGGAIVIWQDGRNDDGDIYAQRIQDAASVDVDPAPAAPALALAGAQPNPARGVVWAAFTLPGGQPGSLELFDLAGRRILARDVGAMGAGFHRVSLDPGAPLAPGHYVLRLRTATGALSRQVVVIR